MNITQSTSKGRLNLVRLNTYFEFLGVIFLASIVVIVGVFSFWRAQNGVGDTDTAFFLDVINNTIQTGIPTTHVVRAFLDVWPLLVMPLAEYCAHDFSVVSNLNPVNILTGHANFIVYPLSSISYFVGPEATAALVNILAFALLPIISYIYLRKNNVSSFLCLLFILVVCTHPAWRISLVGSFYFDRLFMPFALWYALSLHGLLRKHEPLTVSKMLGIAAVVFVGAAIHERAALLLLAFSICGLLLFKGAPRRNVIFTGGVGFTLMIYIIIYLLFQNNIDQQSVLKTFLTLEGFIENVARPGLIKLLFFNFIFLLVVIFFEWRVAVVAIVMVLPNIIVTVGGAEKDGWSTHYHSFYFPFVIYAGIIGIVRISDWCKGRSFANGGGYSYNLFPVIFLGFIGSAMCFQNPYGKSIDWGLKYAAEGGGSYLYDLYVRPAGLSSYRYASKRSDKLVSDIPAGLSVGVSAPFDFWKLVKNKNNISLFPIGIGRSEYLLLAFENDANGAPLFGVTRFLQDQELARQCITDRVWAAGYLEVSRVDHFMILRMRN